jgi:hypothetical protein
VKVRELNVESAQHLKGILLIQSENTLISIRITSISR